MDYDNYEDRLLCSIAFQEYILRQNILQLLQKKKEEKNLDNQYEIEKQILNIRNQIQKLLDLRKDTEIKLTK